MTANTHESEHIALITYITKQTNGDVFFWWNPAPKDWIDYRMKDNVMKRLGEGATVAELCDVFDAEYKPGMFRHKVGALFGKKKFWDSHGRLG